MKNQLKQVQEFNKAFGIKDVSYHLRYNMIKEELNEYYYADDTIEEADAIGDMLYLVFGAVIDAGLEDKIEAIFDEIYRSNMSKLEDGKPIYREDGKVQKGKDYFPPNIKAILDE